MKKYKDIQSLLSYVRRAVDDFDMIADGECVAVGVSGGKDSLAMLCTLHALSRFHPKNFTVKAICIDAGFGATFRQLPLFATSWKCRLRWCRRI